MIGARLNSSRLPGKQLLDLAGRPLIQRLYDRLLRVSLLNQVLLATTQDAFNEPLRAWAQQAGLPCFAYEGDVNDLVGRVDALVQKTKADAVLYVCGDCPLVEPGTIQRMVTLWRRFPWASTVHPFGTQGAFSLVHEGFELFSAPLWADIVAKSTTPAFREHVAASVRSSLSRRPRVLFWDKREFYRPPQRLSVDTPTDYEVMADLHRRWYAKNSQESVVSLPWLLEVFDKDEKLKSLSQKVRQRQVGEVLPRWRVVFFGPISAPLLFQAQRFIRKQMDTTSAAVIVNGDEALSWTQDSFWRLLCRKGPEDFLPECTHVLRVGKTPQEASRTLPDLTGREQQFLLTEEDRDPKLFWDPR